MAINLGGGLKRIYLVVAIIWLLAFLYVSWSSLEKKQIKSYVISEDSCEELETLYKAMDFRVQSLYEDEGMLFMRDGGLQDWIPYSEVISNPNKYELYNNWQDKCVMSHVRPFNDRISKLTIGYAVFGLIPIPIYFLIMFIVRGFRIEEK